MSGATACLLPAVNSLVCLLRTSRRWFSPLNGCAGELVLVKLYFFVSFCFSAATETRQPGESDRGVPAQAEAPPRVRVLRPHGPQRAGPPSQRVGVCPYCSL